MIIAPSILSMDFSKVNESMEKLNDSPVKWIHFDVMDGHFVPNLTFGPDVLRGISQLTNSLMDVHLMIERPQDYAQSFIDNGAQQLTVHIECFESVDELREFIKMVRDQNVMVGLTSKPKTPIHWILELINEVDTILVMSVEPGFGGQSFMVEQLDEIRRIHQHRLENNSNVLIQVDGGINVQTAKLVLEAGVDVIVAGSFIFKGDIQKNVQKIWQL